MPLSEAEEAAEVEDFEIGVIEAYRNYVRHLFIEFMPSFNISSR
jgi:hypothetical protein